SGGSASAGHVADAIQISGWPLACFVRAQRVGSARGAAIAPSVVRCRWRGAGACGSSGRGLPARPRPLARFVAEALGARFGSGGGRALSTGFHFGRDPTAGTPRRVGPDCPARRGRANDAGRASVVAGRGGGSVVYLAHERKGCERDGGGSPGNLT